MMEKTRQRADEARLDAAIRQWKLLPQEGNEAVSRKLQEEIKMLCFDLYYLHAAGRNEQEKERWREAFLQKFEQSIEDYDPEKGAFSHYFSTRLKYGVKDIRQKDNERDKKRLEAPPQGDREEEDNEQWDTVRDPYEEDLQERVEVDHLFQQKIGELTAMIQNFSQRRGRAGNETRRLWFRLFYTEDMTQIFKHIPYRLQHERDAIQAMLLPYLDYYMSAPCRTQREVFQTPLKAYNQVVPEKAGETRETPLPLPAEVSLCYLRLKEGKAVGNSARSNQKQFYKQTKEEIYLC